MTNLVEGFFVCGFGDPASGVGGFAWDLGGAGAVLLTGEGLEAATFALEEGGDALTLELTAADATTETTLSPRTAEIALSGDVPVPVVSVCVADVVPKHGGQAVQCPGQISRWDTDPAEAAGTFRHLAVDAGEESLLVVEAIGEPGSDHGDERSAAWLIRGEEDSKFEDAFISTEYDGDGVPTRFGLELWPEEAERASRGAATRVSASLLGGVAVGDVWAGLFRSHADRSEGIGSYLLSRV